MNTNTPAELTAERLKEIQHIRQQGPYDCGPTCLAMITGMGHSEVLRSFGVTESYTGCTHHDMDQWLTEHGYAVSRLWRFSHGNKQREPWPPQPWADASLAMIEIGSNAHWVVLLRNGTVLDPNKSERTTLDDSTYGSTCQVVGVHHITSQEKRIEELTRVLRSLRRDCEIPLSGGSSCGSCTACQDNCTIEMATSQPEKGGGE